MFIVEAGSTDRLLFFSGAARKLIESSEAARAAPLKNKRKSIGVRSINMAPLRGLRKGSRPDRSKLRREERHAAFQKPLMFSKASSG